MRAERCLPPTGSAHRPATTICTRASTYWLLGHRVCAGRQLNKAHDSLRAIGERGNSLLKMAFKALRDVSLDPWPIRKIVAAALVLLHIDHARTT